MAYGRSSPVSVEHASGSCMTMTFPPPHLTRPATMVGCRDDFATQPSCSCRRRERGDANSGWDVVLWVRRGLKRRGYSHLPCTIDFLRTAGEKLESGHPVLDGRAGAGP